MSDMRDFLGRGIEGFNPSPEEGLERTRDRTRKRHRRRQFLAGAVTVAMFGGTLAGAVWLGDQRGRPIAGPSPSPSPSYDQIVVGGDQVWICTPGFRNEGKRCFARTSPVIKIASGNLGGQPWSLQAFMALYEGPDPKHPVDSGGAPRRRLPMMCSVWRFKGSAITGCERSLGKDALWGTGVPTALMDAPLASPVEPFDEGPLYGIEDSGGGFSGDSRGAVTAVWAWTPRETERVDVEADGVDVGPAVLAGPFESLRTTLKWFVAFFPSDTQTVTYTAHAADGDVLWAETDRYETEPRESLDLVPSSPEVVVASGTYEGGDWELVVYRAIDGTSGSEWLCYELELGQDDSSRSCSSMGELPGGSLGVDEDGDGPLPMFLFGSTAEETARVEIREASAVGGAKLYAAPEELEGDLRFFVGFSPMEADVTVRAYDAQGNELWSDVKPYHPDT